MSMPRRSILASLIPPSNSLPAAGDAVWWPLHGNLYAAIDNVQDMAEVVVAGSANASKWTGSRPFYTFPVDNGQTDKVALTAAHLDDDYDFLNLVLGLETCVGGEEVVICCEADYVEHADANGYFWFYGMNSSVCGGYGLYINTTEVPSFTARGFGGTGSTAVALTHVSGQTFAAMGGQGRFYVVASIHMTDSLHGTVTVNIGHPSVGSGVYTAAADWSAGGATLASGRNGALAADAMGFTVGARNTAAASHDLFWGKGATNTGRIGNVSAKKFAAYSSARSANTLAALLVRPADFPSTFLE